MKIKTSVDSSIAYVVLINDGDKQELLPITIYPNCNNEFVSFEINVETAEIIVKGGQIIIRRRWEWK